MKPSPRRGKEKAVKAWAAWCSCRKDTPDVFTFRSDASTRTMLDRSTCDFGGTLEVVPVEIREIKPRKGGRKGK
jgi:hypothetical protein